jgi:hypothetical protein
VEKALDLWAIQIFELSKQKILTNVKETESRERTVHFFWI